MAGIINTAINQADPLSSVAGYTADKIELDPSKDTVAGQIDTIIKADSPLMQGARTRANQSANSRGLINSTMAVQAGEEAVHGAALPIAQQDAATNFRAKELNTGATNTANQFTANAQTTAALQQRQGQQQIESINAQGTQQRLAQDNAAGHETALTTLRGQIETGLQNLKGTQAKDLAEIEASYKTLMQTNDSAGKMYQQTMDAINKILMSTDMDAATKQSAIDKQTQMLRIGMSTIGKVSNIPGLPDLLDFSGEGSGGSGGGSGDGGGTGGTGGTGGGTGGTGGTGGGTGGTGGGAGNVDDGDADGDGNPDWWDLSSTSDG